MRVNQPKPEFRPVTIVLESKEELDAMTSIVGYFEGSEIPREVETFLISLRIKLSVIDR